GKKPGTRDYEVARYMADLDTARKWGMMPKADYDQLVAQIPHQPIQDIQRNHQSLTDPETGFGGEIAPAKNASSLLKAQARLLDTIKQAVAKGIMPRSDAGSAGAWVRSIDNPSDLRDQQLSLD